MNEPTLNAHRVSLGGAVLTVLALLTVLGLGLMAVASRQTPLPQVTVVQAAQDLPALGIISTTQVVTGLVSQVQAQGMVTDVAQAVGGVLVQPIPKGQALPKSALLRLEPDRQLLSVPISDTVPPAVGDRVTLLGVGEGSTAVDITLDGVVVTVAQGIALVAVSPDQASQAAPFLVAPNRIVLVRGWR